MSKHYQSLIPVSLVVFGLGVAVGWGTHLQVANAQAMNRVFELRTYTANPDRLGRLVQRFGDHTIQLFEKHGMTNVGYFTAMDAPLSENTLVYLLAHKDRAAAEASWAAFRADPDWRQIAEETQRDGPMVDNIVSVFLTPTSFSQLK
jgi:hypothetical protein